MRLLRAVRLSLALGLRLGNTLARGLTDTLWPRLELRAGTPPEMWLGARTTRRRRGGLLLPGLRIRLAVVGRGSVAALEAPGAVIRRTTGLWTRLAAVRPEVGPGTSVVPGGLGVLGVVIR